MVIRVNTKQRRDPANRPEIKDWDPASPAPDPVHDWDAVQKMLARAKVQQGRFLTR